jgi:hypothetical protein
MEKGDQDVLLKLYNALEIRKTITSGKTIFPNQTSISGPD